MNFASALALLVGVLVVVPLAAHLLRRGKTVEQEFPPAHLVPPIVVTSDKRSRLEDLLLLALRGLMVAALAVLGATPFVRCSDLTVDRPSGASVALSIVLDDSQSMRTKVEDGRSRFEVAVRGAEQLLSSAREGDVVALIAAGNPARVILNPGPDLSAARAALKRWHVSDRATDLQTAVVLARSALKDLPHVEKRVVVLSDLAAPSLALGEPAPWTPLPELRKPADNCGIAAAEREPLGVLATVGCTTAGAAQGRKLEVVLASDPKGAALASVQLQAFAGVQRASVRVEGLGMDVAVRLSADDALSDDNTAEVALEAAETVIGVSVDPTKAGTVTGGPTVIEQAFSALDPTLDVRPLDELPEAAQDLKRYAALVVDDPPGLSPEERAPLVEWLSSGGVALGLLGPSATNAQLSANIEPFARAGAPWDAGEHPGIDATSVAWLGLEAGSLTSLTRGGRVRLDAADLPETKVIGNWQDGVPFLFRRAVDRGVVFTAGLPASLEQSDFALRPGFLALLQLVVDNARQRSGPKRSVAGTPWTFPGDYKLSAKGPGGPLEPELVSNAEAAELQLVADLKGRYELELPTGKESRLVTLSADELVASPAEADSGQGPTTQAAEPARVDASPYWALLLLGLFAAEMALRRSNDALRRWWARARVRA
jgi:von Willebrand factor type A domain/Aerotolerance regulator N-terminal